MDDRNGPGQINGGRSRRRRRRKMADDDLTPVPLKIARREGFLALIKSCPVERSGEPGAGTREICRIKDRREFRLRVTGLLISPVRPNTSGRINFVKRKLVALEYPTETSAKPVQRPKKMK